MQAKGPRFLQLACQGAPRPSSPSVTPLCLIIVRELPWRRDWSMATSRWFAAPLVSRWNTVSKCFLFMHSIACVVQVWRSCALQQSICWSDIYIRIAWCKPHLVVMYFHLTIQNTVSPISLNYKILARNCIEWLDKKRSTFKQLLNDRLVNGTRRRNVKWRENVWPLTRATNHDHRRFIKQGLVDGLQ